MHRHHKWIICSVCNRTFKAYGETSYPVKHYVPVETFIVGGIEYRTNMGYHTRDVCEGTYKEGTQVIK